MWSKHIIDFNNKIILSVLQLLHIGKHCRRCWTDLAYITGFSNKNKTLFCLHMLFKKLYICIHHIMQHSWMQLARYLKTVIEFKKFISNFLIKLFLHVSHRSALNRGHCTTFKLTFPRILYIFVIGTLIPCFATERCCSVPIVNWIPDWINIDTIVHGCNRITSSIFFYKTKLRKYHV